MSPAAPLTIAVAQIPCPVGAIHENVERIRAAISRARDQQGADLVVFPELTITGYPPDDLLLRNDFLDAVDEAVADVADAARGITVLLGAPQRAARRAATALYNTALVLQDGAVAHTARKRCLPSYSVFDDNRHFRAGCEPCTFELGGHRIGVTICEDLWYPQPAREVAEAGATALININASPFHRGKLQDRVVTARSRAVETGIPILYVNAIGGQDEVVYDGASFALQADGQCGGCWPALEDTQECITLAAGPASGVWTDGPHAEWPQCEESVYGALVRGTADYVHGNGFDRVVIGLSGGIDSALTAAVAVDALGPQQVLAVMMPTRYTADRSLDDAEATARALGIEYRVIPIEPLFTAYEDALGDLFAGHQTDVTEENLQSRIRGNLLMALSNKFGRMLLATGNKSELAVGYATLYGDMCGGFAPLKDVSKTEVYALSAWRNGLGGVVVPQSVIDREPTAELRANQRDADSLPPYPILDRILTQYLEEEASEAQIIERGVEYGIDRALVSRVIGLLYRNEYKRRQAAPGVKVTRRAFGRDRRYPITSGWRGMPAASEPLHRGDES